MEIHGAGEHNIFNAIRLTEVLTKYNYVSVTRIKTKSVMQHNYRAAKIVITLTKTDVFDKVFQDFEDAKAVKRGESEKTDERDKPQAEKSGDSNEDPDQDHDDEKEEELEKEELEIEKDANQYDSGNEEEAEKAGELVQQESHASSKEPDHNEAWATPYHQWILTTIDVTLPLTLNFYKL